MKQITTAIFQILLYTGILGPILPILFFLGFKRKTKEEAVWVIFFYAVYCLINEFMNYYLQVQGSMDTIKLFALFTVVEFSFISYFFFLVIKRRSVRNTIPIIWLSFLIFASIDYFYINRFNNFDSISVGIETILVIIFASYYLIAQIRKESNLLIYSTFNFWVSITILIYFCGTFFLNILTGNMKGDPEFQKLYFIINISFNILKNILLSVAMCMNANRAVKATSTMPNLDDEIIANKFLN